jgi:YgiT-type zinc finger domain-containing protein
MKNEEVDKKWRTMSEAILTGMAEWRQQHPKARFREIEAELDRRLAEMRAKMLSDLAIASASTEWEDGGDGPVCPQCGAKLVGKGKKERKLHTNGGQEVELEREYGLCPQCGQGIFPPG